jgi:hypothetical protein
VPLRLYSRPDGPAFLLVCLEYRGEELQVVGLGIAGLGVDIHQPVKRGQCLAVFSIGG